MGAGLIGGSWGLALRAAGFSGVRVGVDRPDVLAAALERAAIDEAQQNLEAAVRSADLIVLASPVKEISALLPAVAKHAPASALVTDVGSVKAEICERAASCFVGDAFFLGGHPLAGKETSGIEAADATLFAGATYVLTPRRAADMKDPRAQALCALLGRFSARVHVTTAELHDRAVASTSHLPQLLSTALASLLDELIEARGEPCAELAGPGLLSFTRLADSPYAVWHDIFIMNREHIVEALDAYLRKLEDMRLGLSDPGIEREFECAHRLRKQLKDAKDA